MLAHIIKNAESIPLTTSTIKDICNNRVNIFLYHELAEISDPMKLFYKDGFGIVPMVLLYPIRSESDGHWCALIYNRDSNIIYYFDPYGFPIEYYKKYGFYEREYLSELLTVAQENGITIDLAPTKLQKIDRGVNTCGRYSALRAVFSNLSNTEFCNMLEEKIKLNNPDEIVTLMTIIN